MSHSDWSDAKLLARVDKDPSSFRVLYDRYAARVHQYHLRRCRDEGVAVDLSAETFAQAWYARKAFRDEAAGSAGPWLFGIARNVLLQSVRRQRLEDTARKRLGLLEYAVGAQLTPDESWLDGVDELLGTLAPDQRAAVQLRVIDDLSYAQVAQRTSTTPGNARIRVHRALDSLRTRHPNLMSGDPR